MSWSQRSTLSKSVMRGGGVVPRQDYAYLLDAGVAAVFGPGVVLALTLLGAGPV